MAVARLRAYFAGGKRSPLKSARDIWTSSALFQTGEVSGAQGCSKFTEYIAILIINVVEIWQGRFGNRLDFRFVFHLRTEGLGILRRHLDL